MTKFVCESYSMHLEYQVNVQCFIDHYTVATLGHKYLRLGVICLAG